MKMSVYYGTSGIQTLRQGLDRTSTIFFKKCWVVDLTGLTSTTNDFFPINWKLGPSMARSTTFHVFKKNFKTPETSGAQNILIQGYPVEVTP